MTQSNLLSLFYREKDPEVKYVILNKLNQESLKELLEYHKSEVRNMAKKQLRKMGVKRIPKRAWMAGIIKGLIFKIFDTG